MSDIITGVDKRILVWDLAEGTLTTQLKGHKDTVYSLCFCRDGNILASGIRLHYLISSQHTPNRNLANNLNSYCSGLTSVVFTWKHKRVFTCMHQSRTIVIRIGHQISIRCKIHADTFVRHTLVLHTARKRQRSG